MALNILFLSDAVIDMDTDRRAISNRIIYHPDPLFTMAVAHIPQPPSLGVALLAAVIRQEGHNLLVVESAMHPFQREQMQEALSDSPDVICISTTYIVRLENFKKFISRLREKSPRSIIIVGGPSLMMRPEFQNLGDCDIIGDGEISLPKVLRDIESGAFSRAEKKSIQGELQHDLDKLPLPDWGALKRRPDEFYSITTQRGCVWRCAFCTYPVGEGFLNRYRSIPSVLNEIVSNYKNYGITKYFFTDSTFTHPHDRCLELLNSMEKLPFKIEWFAYARVDTITAELVGAMKRSGCVALYLGIESGDNSVLKKMRKGYEQATIFKAMNLLKASGIIKMGSWVVGFPGETDASINITKDVMAEIKCEFNGVHVFYKEDLAPVSKPSNNFNVSGERFNWVTQDNTNAIMAEEWATKLLKTVFAQELLLGGKDALFNFSSVGWGLDKTMEAFRVAQKIYGIKSGWISVSTEAENSLRASLKSLMIPLRQEAMAHPVFSFHKSRMNDARAN